MLTLARGLFLTLLLSTAALAGGNGNLAPDLVNPPDGDTFDIIVQFAPGDVDSTKALLAEAGATFAEDFHLIRAARYRVTAANLAAVSSIEGVSYISPDRYVGALGDFRHEAVAAHAASAHGLTGAGVRVALIDSGVAPGFASVAYAKTFFGASTADDYGHGSHVAALIASRVSADAYRGLAPAAEIVSLKVAGVQGFATDTRLLAALDYAVSHKDELRIRVVNISFGRRIVETHRLDPLTRAVQAATEAGLVVVTAAGNLGRDGYGTITSPGNSPYAITVGATKTNNSATFTDDQIATYSSRGPSAIDLVAKPDLVAPGNRVGVQLPGSGQRSELSGTSFAAPAVSAAAALILEARADLTPGQVKSILVDSAQSHLVGYEALSYGAGYLDLASALSRLGGEAPADAFTGAIAVAFPFPPTSDSVIWGGRTLLDATGLKPASGGGEMYETEGVVWGGRTLLDATGLKPTSGGGEMYETEGVVWGGRTLLDGGGVKPAPGGGDLSHPEGVVWGGRGLVSLDTGRKPVVNPNLPTASTRSVIWGSRSISAGAQNQGVVWGGRSGMSSVIFGSTQPLIILGED